MTEDTLSQEHRRMLENGSGISPEVIALRGYRTITAKKELAKLGFSPVQHRVPGLLIPLHAPDGTPAGYQFRPYVPRTDRRGKTIKYETPTGSTIRIDCPPLCRPELANPSVPICITEGSKKADSLASHGRFALALTGVWGFKGRNEFGGKTVLADLDYVAWNELQVSIVFDSDVVDKRQVQDALKRLTEHLRRKGAQVRHVYLPSGPNDNKVGVDDFLAAARICVMEVPALTVSLCGAYHRGKKNKLECK